MYENSYEVFISLVFIIHSDAVNKDWQNLLIFLYEMRVFKTTTHIHFEEWKSISILKIINIWLKAIMNE